MQLRDEVVDLMRRVNQVNVNDEDVLHRLLVVEPPLLTLFNLSMEPPRQFGPPPIIVISESMSGNGGEGDEGEADPSVNNN